MEQDINFDAKKASAFRAQYIAAKDRGDEQFTFEGRPILVSYAKYVVEYLTTQGLLR